VSGRRALQSRADAVTHLRLASELAGLDVPEVCVPTDHHIVVNGLRLHYLDWGRHACPPLLFLHGGRLTAHTWDLVCLALCTDFHCVAVDQRGHGDSAWSPVLEYEPDAHARDIGGLIHALDLQRPVLVGQSLGGLNAMTYATRAANQLAGVVLLDVGPDVQSKGAKRITNFVADPGPGTLEDFVERARLHNPRRDPRLLRYSLLHNLRRLPDQRWTWKYDPRRITPEHFASLMSSLQELRDHAHTITCPVLVMRGAESDVLTDAQAASFAAALPDARWVRVEASGHNIQSDNPRGVIQVLTDFLAEVG
jgi:pimeloyl-ACP methyl ester carboxylesterase